MRKLFLLAGLAFAASGAFGQKLEKLDDVKEKIQKGKYDEAKEKLDKVFESPQANSNSDALFYRAIVYHNLAKTKNDSAMSKTAMEDMRKYLKLEESKPEGQRDMLSKFENYNTLIDMYRTAVNQGVEQLRNNGYSTALFNFEKALDAFTMLKARNLVTAPIDTNVVYYAGASAQNVQKYDQAARYYNQLIDAKIADTGFVNVYRFMINYNLDQKDTAAARKYLDLSKTTFPQKNDLWLDYETLFLSTDRTKRIGEYEALVKANPQNEQLAQSYAVELYNLIRSSENAEKDTVLQSRSEAAFKNLLTIDPNSPTGNLLLSQLYWSQYYTVQNKIDNIRGNFPEAVKKKKELNTQVDAIFERTLPYLTKATEIYGSQTTLKPQDRANYRIVLGQLVEYYNRKKNTAKAAEYQKKLDTLK
jgi:hypothetical protein